ncbi:MAG TPA: VOC family protein [Acidimicrobiia bacterium]|nr:VOC family protein [Acidimicrobiia bacterium]
MMTVPTGLNHVAMSVPAGTLTDQYRSELLEFYNNLFGWREIDSLRLPDRLTVSVGRHCYLNVRERPDPMVCSGYEHFGIVVASAEETERLWNILARDPREVHLEQLEKGDDGFRSFRFRYLLPLTVEVQFFPQHDEPRRPA